MGEDFLIETETHRDKAFECKALTEDCSGVVLIVEVEKIEESFCSLLAGDGGLKVLDDRGSATMLFGDGYLLTHYVWSLRKSHEMAGIFRISSICPLRCGYGKRLCVKKARELNACKSHNYGCHL